MRLQFALISSLVLITIGCSKHDDAPVTSNPSPTTSPVGNPKNPCDRGGTIVINNSGGISPQHTFDIPISNFMPSCGDSVNVFLSNPGQNIWSPIPQTPTQQPNWYTPNIGSIEIHNGSQVQQDWSLSATERS